MNNCHDCAIVIVVLSSSEIIVRGDIYIQKINVNCALVSVSFIVWLQSQSGFKDKITDIDGNGLRY